MTKKQEQEQKVNDPMTQERETADMSLNRRQSAPRPTAEEYAIQQEKMMPLKETSGGLNGVDPSGVQDGFRTLNNPIGREQIAKAQAILNKYKEGKANLERRIVENEQWYKLRHWECMRGGRKEVEPTSGWLFNCIANKHAQAMDNFPSPNILPREEGDDAQAHMLSSIIPVVLDTNDFEQTYSDVWTYKLKSGTGVYGVFWDADKLNGLGDISIKKIDLINLYWESGIMDIQKSHNLFHVELVANDDLVGMYPQLSGKLGQATMDITKYVYDDSVDTTDKSVVVDWYYKKRQNGKTVLHYCKYVNDNVLFATENEPEFRDRGWYDHGLYPFEFDVLYSIEGTPTGFGYIDVGKSAQEYIDRLNEAIMKNALVCSRPRHFVRNDGGVNEEEYADLDKDFIHVDGTLGSDSIRPVSTNTLSDIYVTVLNNKIEELKETTGNRDISTGGTTSGVTAASAIAALQESGSALSRDSNGCGYRAFRNIVLMVIELIRQFYDTQRCFRIVGENGAQQFVQFSNAGILPQAQGMDFGIDMGYRLPLFDVEVVPEKQSPYTKMSQNELALQFYSAGFFAPNNADQSLACLAMMDFDRKEPIMQRIAQNGTMYQQMMMMQQQMLMLAQMVDQSIGSNIAEQLAAQFSGGVAPLPVDGTPNGEKPKENDVLGGDSLTGGESKTTAKARQKTANATAPR